MNDQIIGEIKLVGNMLKDWAEDIVEPGHWDPGVVKRPTPELKGWEFYEATNQLSAQCNAERTDETHEALDVSLEIPYHDGDSVIITTFTVHPIGTCLWCGYFRQPGDTGNECPYCGGS